MIKEQNEGCGNYFSAPFYRNICTALIFFCILLVAYPLYAEPLKDSSFKLPETRALWVVRDTITTKSEIEEVVDFAVKYGYNVLFVQVRGRGDAYYKSYFVPGPESFPHIPDEFDPLASIIEYARPRGIEIHAWFNMYYTWSEDNPPKASEHLVKSHPEWFMVSVNGINMAKSPINSVRNKYIEGLYISPTLEEVRSYLSRVITEVLIRYDIDGVHLDYIRYPGREYDYTNRIRQQFYSLYGVDPVTDVVKSADDETIIYFLEKWVDYRAEQIDRQVRSISRRISFVNRGIKLSAAVKPDVNEAYFEYGQNWAGWLNEGIMDFVVTMSYFRETDVLSEVLNNSLQQVDKQKVLGGVGAYILTPEKTAEQVLLMSNMGLPGYCIFSYTTLKDNPGFSESLHSLLVSYNKALKKPAFGFQKPVKESP